MIRITSKGDYRKTNNFLNRLLKIKQPTNFDRYGQMGVEALAKATPIDSSLTANSWAYRIVKDSRGPGIEWYNTNPAGNTSVAILIQYGHATGTGGYVQGRDYINPAMQPIFDRIADEFWKEVSRG